MSDDRDRKRLIGLLDQIAETAERASMTGSLNGAVKPALAQYNRIRELLGRQDDLTNTLFPPLAEDASFDEIGLAAGQLAEWLKHAGGEEECREPDQLGGSGNVSIKIGDLALGDLSNLGELIRSNLPAWLRGEVKAPDAEAPPAAAVAVGAASAATAVPAVPCEPTLDGVESRLAELGERMSALGLQMERGDLSQAELLETARMLRKLGEEQAKLACNHAALRQPPADPSSPSP